MNSLNVLFAVGFSPAAVVTVWAWKGTRLFMDFYLVPEEHLMRREMLCAQSTVVVVALILATGIEKVLVKE